MTEAPPRQPAAPPRALRRSDEGRILTGVCAGLGRRTGIDPVVFRVGFGVLLLGSGIGLFLYIAAFLLMKDPSGKPGIIELWTRRDFDDETVMALLTAVLGFGLAINLATVWIDSGTLVVGVTLAVSLLAAHASGVDLRALVRSLPERLMRRRDEDPLAAAFAQPPSSVRQDAPAPSMRVNSPAPPMPPNSPTAPVPPNAPTPPVPPNAPEPPVRPVPTPAATPEPVPAAETAAEATEPAAEDSETAAELAAAAEAIMAQHAAEAVTAQHQAETTTARHEAEAVSAQNAAEASERADAAAAAQADAVTAQHDVPPSYPPPPYRPQPKTAVDYTPYGRPFAPNGPYQPLDPARRAGYSPYDPIYYDRPFPRTERRRRPRSFIGVITILLAFIIGGIVMAVQARSAAGVSPTIVGGAMLITIGAGLLVAAWWGRGAGLVAAATTIALLVAVGLMLGGVPANVGQSEWTPTTVKEANARYDVGVGDGRLDLSELELTPGTSVTFNASVTVGELVVIVPPTARVEVHATNKVGDIKLDQSLKGGVDVRLDRVLEPELKPDEEVSTIVLHLKGGMGDMEVRRAA
ncbi:PspC domain-containing protein [Nonomuraea jiangxiensis]|nr:PspC domain-containing protein [Nonomuraea jiangxiensis]